MGQHLSSSHPSATEQVARPEVVSAPATEPVAVPVVEQNLKEESKQLPPVATVQSAVIAANVINKPEQPSAKAQPVNAQARLEALFADERNRHSSSSAVGYFSALPDACLCNVLSFLSAGTCQVYPSRSSLAASTVNSRIRLLSHTVVDPRCVHSMAFADAFLPTALRLLDLAAVHRNPLTDSSRAIRLQMAAARVLIVRAATADETHRATSYSRSLFGCAYPLLRPWDQSAQSIAPDALLEALALEDDDRPKTAEETIGKASTIQLLDIYLGAVCTGRTLELLAAVSGGLLAARLSADSRAPHCTERELQSFVRGASQLRQLALVGGDSNSVPLQTDRFISSADLHQRQRAWDEDGGSAAMCNDMAVLYVAKNCHDLRALRLSGGKIGNQGLQSLSQYSTELRHLDLGDKLCFNVCEDGVNALRACNRLTSFHAAQLQRVPVEHGWRPFLQSMLDNAHRAADRHDVTEALVLPGCSVDPALPQPASCVTHFGGGSLKFSTSATTELEALVRDLWFEANGTPKANLFDLCWRDCSTIDYSSSAVRSTVATDKSHAVTSAVPSLVSMAFTSAIQTELEDWVHALRQLPLSAVAQSRQVQAQQLLSSSHSSPSLGSLALLNVPERSLPWWSARYFKAPAQALTRVEIDCVPDQVFAQASGMSPCVTIMLSMARCAPLLQRLDFRGCVGLTDESIELLAVKCPCLVSVCIASAASDHSALGDRALSIWGSASHLVELTMPLGTISDAALDAVGSSLRLASLTLLPGADITSELSNAAVVRFCEARGRRLVHLSLAAHFGSALDIRTLATLVGATPNMRAFACKESKHISPTSWQLARQYWPWSRVDGCNEYDHGARGTRGVLVGGRLVQGEQSASHTSDADSDSDDDESRLKSRYGAAFDDPIKKKYAAINARRNAPKQAVEWREEFGREQADLDKKVFMGVLNLKNISGEGF